MIPYDDLVAALQAWRVKQGLPVGELNAVSLTPAMATSFPASAPARTAPPAPPPRASPMPLAPAEDSMEVEDAAMLEDHYDNEGSDFAMAFGNEEAESTALGSPPEKTTLDHDPGAGKSKKRGNYDW
jgi:hypothetical protein